MFLIGMIVLKHVTAKKFRLSFMRLTNVIEIHSTSIEAKSNADSNQMTQGIAKTLPGNLGYFVPSRNASLLVNHQ